MSKTRCRCLVVLIFLAASTASFGATAAQDDSLQQRYDAIERQTAGLRGLSIQGEIEVTFKTSDELRAELERDLDTDYPPEDRERDERILAAFGLAPQEVDLSSLYVDLYSEQVAGYYDTETGEMVVIRPADAGDELSPLQEITYAHEVVHALQDQNFPLDEALELAEGATDDQVLATTALVEGDATVAQSEYLTDNPGLLLELGTELMTTEIETSQLDAAPAIVRETLLFPYDQGAEFVMALREEGDWARVNEAYTALPASTEQILHPEKYLSGEQPIAVDLKDIEGLLGEGWTEIDDNAFGEFQIRILLSGQESSAGAAGAAAAGWGGDRFRIATNGQDTAVVWQSTWDSTVDATEFADALTRYDERRFGTEQVAGDGDGERVIASDGRVSVVATSGEQVTYILAPDDATVDRLLTHARS